MGTILDLDAAQLLITLVQKFDLEQLGPDVVGKCTHPKATIVVEITRDMDAQDELILA
jgi:hypothetical protein